MPNEYIQPPELFNSNRLGFTQVVTSPPGKLVFISGQVAWDTELKIVGGSDLAAQAAQSLANLGHALRAASASTAGLTMIRTFVVDYRPEHGVALAPLLREFIGNTSPPASTLIGVQSLAAPGLLIEIDAVAVVTEESGSSAG